jgi:RHS repeat-associated protein
MSSTLPAIPAGTFLYNANDELQTDAYDANGNTASSGGLNYAYDFENHLVQQGGISIVYDGDGNRVSKTVAGVTTKYWVDMYNPTGYAQVLQEIPPNNFPVQYYYGLELLERYDTNNGRAVRYYVYDGHGSVRALTDSSGNVTDTYDGVYPGSVGDAFGNEIHSTGTSPNNYLFAGEQYDPDLNLYYNRARYLNTNTGRFWNMDSEEGNSRAPLSLHKYLYASTDPVDRTDPSGNEDLAEVAVTTAVVSTLALNSFTAFTFLNNTAAADFKIDGALVSFRFNANAIGGTVGAGIDVVFDRSHIWYALSEEYGIAPLSIFGPQRGAGISVAAGPIFGMNNPNEMSGRGIQAVWPSSIAHLLPAAMFSGNKAWGAMSQLAKRAINVKGTDLSFALGVSTSGSAFFQVGVRSNSFSELVSETTEFKSWDSFADPVKSTIDPILQLLCGGMFDSTQSLVDNADSLLSIVGTTH